MVFTPVRTFSFPEEIILIKAALTLLTFLFIANSHAGTQQRDELDALIDNLMAPQHLEFVNEQKKEEKAEEPKKPQTLNERIKEAKSEIKLDDGFLVNLRKIDKNLFCAAQATFFEAGNQSFFGKLAVAEVVMNRKEHNGYPDSVCGVVHERSTVKTTGKVVCQFSWACAGKNQIPLTKGDGSMNLPVLKQWHDSVMAAILVVEKNIRGVVPGATNFFAHHIVNPGWAGLRVIKVIDGHTFMGPRRVATK